MTMREEVDGESEDLDRLPDGVPHAVIGLTAFLAVTLAVVLILLLTGDRDAIAGAVAVGAVPVMVSRLVRKSERERDVVHPSR